MGRNKRWGESSLAATLQEVAAELRLIREAMEKKWHG